MTNATYEIPTTAEFWNALTKEETVKYLKDLWSGVAKPIGNIHIMTGAEQDAWEKEQLLDGDIQRIKINLKASCRKLTSFRPNLRNHYC